MRKRIAFLLAVLMLVLLLPVNASDDVIFFAINNTVLRPLSADNIPILIDGNIYVPYKTLANLGSVKCFYNQQLDRILVYDFWERITFDLKNDTAFDENGADIEMKAVRKNGVIYVPIAVIANKFDFYIAYSHFSDLAPLIRLNEGEQLIGDEAFTSSVSRLLKTIFDEYKNEQSAPPPEKPPAPPIPEKPSAPPPSQKKAAFLAVCGDPSEYGARLLRSIGATPAAFFLTAEQINANGDLVRRLYSENKTVGVYIDAQAEKTPAEQMKEANDALRRQAFTATRNVFLSESVSEDGLNALKAEGACIWEGGQKIGGLGESALNERFASAKSGAVFRLDIGASAFTTVPALRRFCEKQSFTLLPPCEWNCIE